MGNLPRNMMTSESIQDKSTLNSLLTDQASKRILMMEDEAIIAINRELHRKVGALLVGSGEKAVVQVKREQPFEVYSLFKEVTGLSNEKGTLKLDET
ncbi:MAG: hypothetical protein MJE63_03620 [Proteobacteria bacterium]|nr:hypothetical protein [Pseudomonadota bacterium]